jgi:hypothetical protein
VRVADAKAKIAAAKERDRLDAELAKLPVPKALPVPGSEAPVADPYVANVGAILREVGFNPSERIIKAEEALSRALGFELLAALGPTCCLALINVLALGGAHVSAAAARGRKPVAKALPASEGSDPTPTMPENADDYDRCLADVFEEAPTGAMKAKEIRPLVQAWFATRGLRLSEGKLWARMRDRFKYDPNNNRPRYLGLKVRVKGQPRLALVSAAQA